MRIVVTEMLRGSIRHTLAAAEISRVPNQCFFGMTFLRLCGVREHNRAGQGYCECPETLPLRDRRTLTHIIKRLAFDEPVEIFIDSVHYLNQVLRFIWV